MALFTGKPGDLLGSGPLVAVKLWVPRQVPSAIEPLEVLAEINIACSRTYIQEGVATSLGLQPDGTINVATSTRLLFEANQFLIRVIFPDANRAFQTIVTEVPYMLRPHKRIRCIIGREILQFGILTYNGRGNTFSFDL